jgi:hypothetical protein
LSLRLALLVTVAAAIAMILCAVYVAIKYLPKLGRLSNQLGALTTKLALQAKFKIVVSFYQVCATLSSVYGVRLHPYFTGWLDVFGVLSFDIFDLSYPSACV